MVATVTSTFLSGISGSGSADTAAVSSILLPGMRRRGYDIDYSVAVAGARAAHPALHHHGRAGHGL
ncbi:Tripartite ATP-independent transporter, DctM component [Belnapia rosea]|nr:Tripartite ATP-independent transporter, DctM component [Belnapia rosea]